MEDEKNSLAQNKSTKSAAIVGGGLLLVIVIIGGFYLLVTRNQIYTDKADIEAPLIAIAPSQGGTLQKMLVTNGQQLEASTPVAQVADQILRSDDQPALVVEAQSLAGKSVGAGEAVVSVIHSNDLRVVAHIDEDKGLSGIRVGQLVTFTVDTFAGKKYTGIVAEISQTSRQSGVVFNISDQREIRQFDVKIKFDVQKYSELKNGMSAKVTIFKN
jgi:multidrug resistance efflux pump